MFFSHTQPERPSPFEASIAEALSVRGKELISQELNASLLARLSAKAAQLHKFNGINGYHSYRLPEGPLSLETVASDAASIFTTIYGNEYPIPEMLQDAFFRSQVLEGKLTSYYVMDPSLGRVVGVAGIRHCNFDEWQTTFGSGYPLMVELGRAAIHPDYFSGEKSPKVTAVMVQRLVDFLSGSTPEHLMHLVSNATLIADCRASEVRILSNGSELPSGARTTHNAYKTMSFSPTRIHASYKFGTSDCPVYEPMVMHSRHIDICAAQDFIASNPIVLPGGADAAYWEEFGSFLGVLHSGSELRATPLQIEIARVGNRPASALNCIWNGAYYAASPYRYGNYPAINLSERLNEVVGRHTMQISVPATHTHVETMRQLVGAGAVPVGFMSGIETQVFSPVTGQFVPYNQPHTIQFQMAAPGTFRDTVPGMDLPREYPDELKVALEGKLDQLRAI